MIHFAKYKNAASQITLH